MEQTAEDVEVSQITNNTEVGCRSPTIKLGAPSEEESGPLSRDELQALWESDPLTAVMCEGNGLSLTGFLNKAEKFQRVDMFLQNFPRMHPIAAFPALTQLFLIRQDIQEITALHNCTQLKECVIMECQVEVIEGLENCTLMEKLDLGGNNIERISGLTTLVNLKHLWLADNYIRRIQGLETLEHLTDLNLAGNRIDRIGTGLNTNMKLQCFNLADNLIGGFKDLLNLTPLPNLTKLVLQDAQYGSNFVCALCNYQTYVLCHVQHITSLDNSIVTIAAHQTAEATFIKKKMYYNMRIKTLKRSSSAVIKQALEMRSANLAQVGLNMNVLFRHYKDIERELDEHEHKVGPLVDGCTPVADVAAAQGVDLNSYMVVLRKKLAKLREAVAQKEEQIKTIEGMFEKVRQQITEVTHQQISRLVLELETGGNIRLEDGKPTDAWYSSCVDLMCSRFFADEFKPFGVGGIVIHRVTRVHNRCLRNHFEEKVEQFCADSGSDTEHGKRALEYLFAAEDPNMTPELHSMAEHGFRDVDELEEMGLGDSIKLTNSLTFVEPLTSAQVSAQQQLREFELPANMSSRDGAAAGNCDRTVLVTKVLLGNSTCEIIKKKPRVYPMGRSSPIASPSPSGGGCCSPLPPRPAPSPTPEPQPLPDVNKMRENHSDEFHSVYRSKVGDPKQKQWFVFDSAMILPEYLVEYRNSSIEEWEKHGPAGPDQTELLAAVGVSPEMLVGMGPLARPFESFVLGCAEVATNDEAGDPVMSVVNAAPTTTARPKLEVINLTALGKYFSTSSLGNLTYLNLHSNSIRQLENLAVCTGLKVLVCSFNEIHRIEGLEQLTQLEKLDLGFNFIKRIEGLQQLVNLKSLELNNNLIYRLEDLTIIKKHNPVLVDINLSNNAISEIKSYRDLVLSKLENLEILDGKALTEQMKASAANTSSTMTSELLLQCSHFVQRSQWSHVHKQQSLACPNAAAQNELVRKRGDNWMPNVEELDMDHRRLRKIASLQKMTKLRRASFCDNELVRIEGLEHCLGLEELFLEENRILKIESLQTLSNLRKLDLGRNKISRADGLDSLTMLTELSLEDNDIEELSQLASLQSLMELYLCNNKVASLSELLWLKELPKLIILDMFGNPCFEDVNYRLHTIFYLKKLKVLDGVPVDMIELNAARDKYAGRITEEWLEEHLGHADFEQVAELQLESSHIRECGILCTARFQSLHALNLDNNQLWDLSTFTNLPHLMILKLNNNRVGAGPAKVKNEGENVRRRESATVEPYEITKGFPHCDCLPSLEVLYLEGNQINSMAGLGLPHLRNLRVLHLGDNEISRIEGVNTVQHLRELNLNKNKIKHVDEDAFVGLTSLRELYMEENGLKSLANFHFLAFLHTLHLATNRLQDLSEIDKLVQTRTLLEISVNNNPIARKAFYRVSIIKRLHSLQVIDGKPISWEERERADAGGGGIPGDSRSSYHTTQHHGHQQHHQSHHQQQQQQHQQQQQQHQHQQQQQQQHQQYQQHQHPQASMYPAIVQDTRRTSGGGHARVPVKVTSVTFECIGGIRSDDSMMLGGVGAGKGSDVLLTREQQQAVIAGQTRADDLFDAKGVTSQPRDEFFLPNVGGGKIDFPRRRTNTDSRQQAAASRPQSTMSTADKPPRNPNSAPASGAAKNQFNSTVYKQPRLTINAGGSGKRSTPRTSKANPSR